MGQKNRLSDVHNARIYTHRMKREKARGRERAPENIVRRKRAPNNRDRKRAVSPLTGRRPFLGLTSFFA